MKKFITLLLISSLCFGVDAPKKLQDFIYTNIGKNEFFAGVNSDKKQIVVSKYKDWGYIDFDLYKAVEMSIGLSVPNGKHKREITLDQTVFLLEVQNHTDHELFEQTNQTRIDFVFTKVR